MRKLRLLLLAMSLLLPLLVTSAALAQDGDDDDDGDADRMHPVVKLLAYYLDEDEDEIADYHDDGIGFGVMVKLYAIAAENDDVDVDELVEMFRDGMGLGEIYKEYGKPGVLGVGQVRRLPVDDDGEDEPPTFLPPGHGGTPPGHGGLPPGQAKKWADPPGGDNHIVPLPIVPEPEQ